MAMLTVEIIGHILVQLTFIAVVAHTIRSHSRLRRGLRSSRVIYVSTLLLSVVFLTSNSVRLVSLFSYGLLGTAPMLDLLSEYPSIIAMSLVMALLIRQKIVIERTYRPRRVLAIGAHPDDIEIAAGATIAKLQDAGHQVYGLVMTQGEQGGNAQLRPSEARNGASFLEMNSFQMLKFEDTNLKNQTVELVNAIEKVIDKFKPDIILTHSAHDIHQDHQAVHEATMRAGRNANTILCYESPSVTQEFVPTFFVNVATYVEVKLAAIRTHWDQRNKPYMKEDQVRGKLAFRGGQAKVEFAEGFEVLRMLSTSLGDI
ncbi:MAG: PIG-L family deacetylase [Anaerolineaceae bacterium]|nr:PIG-L family deacetylase [Anaerolineaceae bacterium]